MTGLRARDVLLLPLHAAALATGAKSFRANPLLASPRLNRGGLHLMRLRAADRMAASRRARLGRLVAPEHAAAIERDGFVVIRDALPREAFRRLCAEVEGTRFPAREMKQGDTVTRFIALPPTVLLPLPELRAFAEGPLFQGLLRYAASFEHAPIVTLHAVLTDPTKGQPDPQTLFHSDTFHATAKGWLFLRDVQPEDGPFRYVPGSHRLTPGRLEWERTQSLTAAASPDPHHAAGSFRASPGEIRAMGYPDPVDFAVPANTLVVADTHGFHARGISHRPSVRLAVYGSLRAAPFNPFAGLDPFRLPGLRGRKAQALDLARALAARLTGRPESQPPVGLIFPGDPPVR